MPARDRSDRARPLHRAEVPGQRRSGTGVRRRLHLVRSRPSGQGQRRRQGKGRPLYVMGDPTDPKAPGNYWRHADDWPPPSRATPFFFHPDGTLARDKPPEGNDAKTYAYDPKDPVPNVGGQELGVPLGPMDQRRVENRPDVLLFSTEALKEPVEVTGRITAKLFVSSDC